MISKRYVSSVKKLIIKGAEIYYEQKYHHFGKLKKRYNDRKNSYLRMKIIGDFKNLAALEARYHKTCHTLYINNVLTPKNKMI